jgi:hypothetical protein
MHTSAAPDDIGTSYVPTSATIDIVETLPHFTVLAKVVIHFSHLAMCEHCRSLLIVIGRDTLRTPNK